jgi:hypothetical protein
VNPFKKAFLLLTELGPAQLADNLVYRLQLRSGWYEKLTPSAKKEVNLPGIDLPKRSLFSFDWVNSSKMLASYLRQADEVTAGNYRPFGNAPEKLDFSLSQPLQHWTRYGDTLNGLDIKLVWEPARFSWVIPLCIAYAATKNEKYPAAFWKYFEAFLQNNPVNQGPNWSSAQEVALRLIPWSMAVQVFADSAQSTLPRKQLITQAIWEHVQRIPPTLGYARSQQNNHLLSEALGLMIGGWWFQNIPQGKRWLTQGNREFQKGIIRLVDEEGTFSQHSVNYQRMLLHLASIHQRLACVAQLTNSPAFNSRLKLATKWLTGQLDLLSGKLPNLGHNDGSNLLQVGSEDYSDYRPTLQAASRAFLGEPCLNQGKWDDLSRLFNSVRPDEQLITLESLTTPAIQRIGTKNTWASLRVPHFQSRPAHADLLHVDLWWQGINIALDPGTYSYNSPAPWDNSLMATKVHNTVTINDQDQMFREGKFLWLQRPKTEIISKSEKKITAKIRCNLPIAYTQIREVQFLSENEFEVNDSVEIERKLTGPIPVTIQWLLPDCSWQIKENGIVLTLEGKAIHIDLSASNEENGNMHGKISLIRAGESLSGDIQDPVQGWFSASYWLKSPALSFSMTFAATRNIQIKTLWLLQNK